MPFSDHHLILHPGMPKSASSFIQSVLQKNAAKTSECGFTYCAAARETPFAIIEQNGVETWAEMHLERLNQAVNECEKTIFLSYEHYFGKVFGDGFLFPQASEIAERIAPELERFQSFKMVFIFRRLPQFIVSVANQHRKQGSIKTFGQRAQEFWGSGLSLDRLMQAIERLSLVGPVEIFPFEVISESQTKFFKRFMHALGLDLNELDIAGGRVNPSVTETALEILKFSKSRLEQSDYIQLRRFMEKRFPKNMLTDEESDFISRIDAEARGIEQSFWNWCMARKEVSCHFVPPDAAVGPA